MPLVVGSVVLCCFYGWRHIYALQFEDLSCRIGSPTRPACISTLLSEGRYICFKSLFHADRSLSGLNIRWSIIGVKFGVWVWGGISHLIFPTTYGQRLPSQSHSTAIGCILVWFYPIDETVVIMVILLAMFRFSGFALYRFAFLCMFCIFSMIVKRSVSLVECKLYINALMNFIRSE